jgi:rhodanese-related sulfurtransferase
MPQGLRFEKLCAEAKTHINELSAAEAADRQAKGALLIDVREAEEFAKDHAVGATPLSKGVLELKIEQAAPDPATEIICYCGGGNRSALAAESLQRMGYENVASMTGGFKAWKAAELPTES